jgi:hypothetical protein
LVTSVERMSQKTSEFEPGIRRLERQAAELMHKDTDILTVVTDFAFTDTPVSDPAKNEWKAQYGYRPMGRAFDCKELPGFTTTELSEYLADAKRARTLGFNPTQFAADKTARMKGKLNVHKSYMTTYHLYKDSERELRVPLAVAVLLPER